METKHYDVIVIGGGSGMKIMNPASKKGLKVALCERWKLGGTCLNRGCIPSKMFIYPAQIATQVRTESEPLNVPATLRETQFEALVDRVCATIDRDSDSIGPRIQANPNVDWYHESVRFIGNKTLLAPDSNVTLTGDKIFLATGAQPSIPNIPGLAGTPYMTSTEALRCRTRPKSLIVFGGGYIACELAFYFAGMGVDVTLMARTTLLRHEDSEIAAEFARVFSALPHMTVHTHTKFHQVSCEGVGDTRRFSVEYSSGEDAAHHTLASSDLLVATGVVPCSADLNLTSTGIEPTPRGFIPVDERLRTPVEGIWALGDVVGHHLFRHAANYQSEYLAANVIYEGRSWAQAGEVPPIAYHGMPHAVFSYPQIAGVGPTEDELQAAQSPYVKGVNPYSSSAYGMAMRAESGLVKILVHKETRKLLGCHIVGHEASVLVHEVIPFVQMGLRLDDLLETIHIHPALSELVRNAARKARDALVSSGVDIPAILRFR